MHNNNHLHNDHHHYRPHYHHSVDEVNKVSNSVQKVGQH